MLSWPHLSLPNHPPGSKLSHILCNLLVLYRYFAIGICVCCDFVGPFCTYDIYYMSVHPGRGISPLWGLFHFYSLLQGFLGSFSLLSSSLSCTVQVVKPAERMWLETDLILFIYGLGVGLDGIVRMSLYSTYGFSVKSLLKYMVACVLMCLSVVCSKTKWENQMILFFLDCIVCVYLVIKDAHCVQCMEVLLQQCRSSRVKVDFIQL